MKMAENKYEQYDHHGTTVWVRSELKGKHRDHCLCHSCERFNPGEEDNCPFARLLYRFCVDFDMVTPVWECPNFMSNDTKFEFKVLVSKAPDDTEHKELILALQRAINEIVDGFEEVKNEEQEG
jgi:hypothetical protein